MPIPKIIHYCWFGGKKLPNSVKQYIDTWREKCPDYQIIEWNESNSSFADCLYAKEAYEAQKWAFVSDYVRFCAVYEKGGIYLDTDIEVLRNFDDLLNNRAVFGFGNDNSLTVPIFAAEKGHDCIKKIIDLYKTKKFIMQDSSFDTTAIEKTVEQVLVKNYGLILNGKSQKLHDGISILPKEYFFARDYMTGKITTYPELYIIHYGDGTWLDDEAREILNYQHKYARIFGDKFGVDIGKAIFYLRKEGLNSMLKKAFKSIANRDR